ncbi:MAG: serine/threonine-protein kinase [Nocardioides sp.]
MDRIGAYTLDAVLGSGAFGTVYAARHPDSGERVAIKALDRMPGDVQSVRAQLLHEADALRAVQSEYCLRVLDVVDSDGVLALVTDYVEAVTLRQLTQAAGPLGGREALTVLWGAAQGLAAVHAAGLVHGDVKPANILVEPTGTSRLIDFGLATAPGWITDDDASPWGSPAYASPEQIEHEYRDHRSDIYSLTVSLHEVLCQRRPFTADTVDQIRWMHVHQPLPDPRLLVPDLGDGLTQLLLWGLAKNPDERPQDVATFLNYFETAAAARFGAKWWAEAAVGTIVGTIMGGGVASGVIAGSAVGGGAAAASVGAAGAGTAAGATGAMTSPGAIGGAMLSTTSAKIAAGVTAGILAVGGVGAVSVATDVFDTGSNGGDQLAVSAPTLGNGLDTLAGPGSVWTVTAEELLPESQIGREPYYGYWDTTVYAFGQVAVAFLSTASPVEEDDYHTEFQLVGLRTRDGDELWRVSEPLANCAPFDDRYLVCSTLERTLISIDTTNGEVTGRGAVDTMLYEPHGDEGTLYEFSFGDDARDWESGTSCRPEAIVALDARTLEEQWRFALEFDHEFATTCDSDDEPGIPELVVNEDTVTANVYEDPLGEYNAYPFVVSRDTGEPADSNAPVFEDGVYFDVTYDDVLETWRTVISRSGGLEVLDLEGAPISDDGSFPAIRNAVHQGRTVVVDQGTGLGGAYDLDSGLEVWSLPEGLRIDNLAWTTDDSQLRLEDWESHSTSVLDASSGTVQWTISDVDLLWSESTKDAVIAFGPEGYAYFDVHDRVSGDVAWSQDIADLIASDQVDYLGEGGPPYPNITTSDDAILVAGYDRIRGFTDFPEISDQQDQDSQDGDSYTTKCGSAPEFVPLTSETAANGVVVTFELRAVCDGGQWVNWSQLRIPIVVDGDYWADGYFDYSALPIWVPEGGMTMRLAYPYANLSVPYQSIADAIASDAGTGEVITVPCEEGPENRDDAPVPEATTVPDEGGTLTATGDAAPNDDERQESALEALQRIAAEDRAAIGALEWTAQLSSKRPGTHDDGIVYDTYDQILELHLSHRARYPEALLAWSGDWPGSYGPSSADYWVTLSGTSDLTTRPVIGWCRREGWSDGDCWAKRLRVTGQPDRNTDRAPADAVNN